MNNINTNSSKNIVLELLLCNILIIFYEHENYSYNTKKIILVLNYINKISNKKIKS